MLENDVIDDLCKKTLKNVFVDILIIACTIRLV